MVLLTVVARLRASIIPYALCLSCFFFGNINFSYAWNALGHRLIAQIAFDNMTPASRQFCENLNHALDKKYGRQHWVYAASWLDNLREGKNVWLKQKHFINQPICNRSDPRPCLTFLPNQDNVVTSLQTTRQYLEQAPIDPQQKNSFNRAFYFRVLIHLVGDLHQPMHAATLVGRDYPTGDQGGNLFPLGHNSIGSNLHTYWDNGGGMLLSHGPTSLIKLKKKAYRIEKRWPCDTAKMDLDPNHWAQESFSIAEKYAYQASPRKRPSKAYQAMVKNITTQRLAIAGCRLAALLNQLEQQHH
ncbi:MAG: S1/P1 nuclease [Legionella sp.]|nr:S1/P1 nuclease [Legionella sp.]